ncbi:MAG: glycosyltransferase [Weeksellaceae bacterium]|nr:glycosyltransferase [Weeksellaceae bacterium]
MSKTNILFITWDGPQTSYMEGLFMPIFQAIQKQDPTYQFHVMQFTWAGAEKLKTVSEAAHKMGIHYTSRPITRKPHPTIGSFLSLWQGAKHIRKYASQHNIHVLMPRSTFPAHMAMKAKLSLPIIFDADGLPIQERVDFSGLKPGSKIYNFLRSIEQKMIENAQLILTRSQHSVQYHIENSSQKDPSKYFVVYNGRDSKLFSINPTQRQKKRKELGLQPQDMLFIYAGSFGPQYGWDIMLQIFQDYIKRNPHTHFLLLTGSPEKVNPLIPSGLKKHISVKSVAFDQVSAYLNAADLAFAIRQPMPSMQGVAPIKLGEYLLTGLPVIASAGIGDTESILTDFPGSFLLNHQNLDAGIQQIVANLPLQVQEPTRQQNRENAMQYFTLQAAANSYLHALKSL